MDASVDASLQLPEVAQVGRYLCMLKFSRLRVRAIHYLS